MLPNAAGIGLRTAHMAAFAGAQHIDVPWLEIHSENFLCDGGPRLAMLDAVASRYPISCHGVGLSLGGATGIDENHLARLKRLFGRVKPARVSEHLAWSVFEGAYLNDLLPLPYTEDSLRVVAGNVSRAQDAFGRQILIENPSAYMTFPDATMDEPEFLTRLAETTGCGLLLDINNVYVSASNSGFDAGAYLRALPAQAIGEIHLAGHEAEDGLLIDTHSAPVKQQVWDLFASTVARIGPRPTLIEWDLNVPALPVLLDEAAAAQTILANAARSAA